MRRLLSCLRCRKQHMPRTYDELAARVPAGAIESVGQREELVIYTGLCIDPTDEAKQRLIPFHEDGPGAAYNALASSMEGDRKRKVHWWAAPPYPPLY